MPLSQELVNIFEADIVERRGRHSDDIQLAVARQRDGAAADMRTLGGFITEQIFRSDNPTFYADSNSGIRVPTTLNHPGGAPTT